MKKLLFYGLLTLFSTYNLYANDYFTLYAHGIVDGPSQIDRFKEAIPTDRATAISFPDTQSETGFGINRLISIISTYCGKPVNRSKMFMGQEDDITTLQQTQLEQPSIYYGCSRGAATILSYIAQYNPENIKALVLDATPCSMPQTMHKVLAAMGFHESWDESLFSSIFPAYPEYSTTPLEAIKYIQNKDLPILLLHSRTDTKVPFTHSLKLYLEFKKQGFHNVHLKDFAYGRHSFLLQDETLKEEYLKAVHSFYKKYELPHNTDYATLELNSYAYDIDQAINEINAYHTSLQDQYEFNWYRNLAVTLIVSAAAVYRYQ